MGRNNGLFPSRCNFTESIKVNHGKYGINKKLETPSKPGENDEAIQLDTIIVGAIARGLSYEGVNNMSIGQVVDYCIEYNKINKIENSKDEDKKAVTREATQADWDRLGG